MIAGRPEPDSYLQPDQPHAGLATSYLEALLQADHRSAAQLVLNAAAGGAGVKDLYLHVFQPVQYEVGRLWELNRATVAQEHYCTAATQMIMARFQDAIFGTPRLQRFAVVACVDGELHAIGSRMVADFLEMEGWDTHYLGACMPPAEIAEAARQHRADLVCLSCSMSGHVDVVARAVRLIREIGESGRPGPRILVGGIPFNRQPGLWRQVGADGWAPDAQQAVELSNHLAKAGSLAGG